VPKPLPALQLAVDLLLPLVVPVMTLPKFVLRDYTVLEIAVTVLANLDLVPDKLAVAQVTALGISFAPTAALVTSPANLLLANLLDKNVAVD